jgi:hypothetical protein
MRRLICTVALLSATTAFAGPLAPGDVAYNPDLAGSTLVGDGGPYYTAGAPAWLNPANIALTQSSPIVGIPGFSEFRGTVESTAYYINGVDASGGIGLSYRIQLAADSAPRLVRAALAEDGWPGVTITDAGSDGSGASASAGGGVVWFDGDPYFIQRDSATSAPEWAYRLGSNGAVLNESQQSALIWFATDATATSQSAIALLDGGAAGAALVLSVPEPATLTLVSVALLSILRRR